MAKVTSDNGSYAGSDGVRAFGASAGTELPGRWSIAGAGCCAQKIFLRALIVTPQISERVDPYAGISPHPAPKAVSDTASRRRRAGIVGPTTVGMRYEVSKIFSEQQNHRKEDGDLTSTLA